MIRVLSGQTPFHHLTLLHSDQIFRFTIVDCIFPSSCLCYGFQNISSVHCSSKSHATTISKPDPTFISSNTSIPWHENETKFWHLQLNGPWPLPRGQPLSTSLQPSHSQSAPNPANLKQPPAQLLSTSPQLSPSKLDLPDHRFKRNEKKKKKKNIVKDPFPDLSACWVHDPDTQKRMGTTAAAWSPMDISIRDRFQLKTQHWKTTMGHPYWVVSSGRMSNRRS